MDDERLINIESALAEHERMLEDLNKIVYEQGQKIDRLVKLNRYLLSIADKDVVKPLSEETPPPHY